MWRSGYLITLIALFAPLSSAVAYVQIGEPGCYLIQGKVLSLKDNQIKIQINSKTRSEETVTVSLQNPNWTHYILPNPGDFVSIVSFAAKRGEVSKLEFKTDGAPSPLNPFEIKENPLIGPRALKYLHSSEKSRCE